MSIYGFWRYSQGYVAGFISGLRENLSHDEPAMRRSKAILSQPDPDDPEVLLDLVMQTLKENQATNRSRAVEAITQKNNLQAEFDKNRKRADNLQAKADLARASGDADLERQLLIEKDHHQVTLDKQNVSLTAAIDRIEQIKTAMRQEEERIRTKTAQTMALKVEWKQRQILANVELTQDADAPTVLSSMRYEVQAFMAQARRLNDELYQQAERALRNGNRVLARAILSERASLQSAFANPS